MAINTTLFGALEDLDEEVGGEEEVEESGVSEDITDAEDDVEGTGEVIDGASTDLEALEEIKDVLEDAAENGDGIDETAAKVVEVAVEAIYARLGIPASNILGSTESFSNVRSRKTATKMAAEGIKDTIVRAWEAVKKFFIDLWKKIKELYARYVTGAGRLEAKAKKVKKYVNSRGSTKKENEIENKSYAEAFCSNNGKDSVLGTQLTNTLTNLKATLAMSDKLTGILEDTGKSSDDLKNAIKKAITDGGFSPAQARTNVEGQTTSSAVLVGNVKIFITISSSAKSFHFDINEQRENRSKTEDAITVEDKDSLNDNCDKIMHVARAVADICKKDKSDAKVLKAIDRVIKDASSDAKKDSATDDDKDDASSAQLARELLRAKGKLAIASKKIALHGCNKALGYITKAASMYEK